MGETRTLSIGSTSDLVVRCPWAPGIIPAEEPSLYRTRLAITFKMLFEMLKTGREARRSLLANPLDKLEQIHSFRLSAEEDALHLSVTYDFGFENYMQALQETGGPILDLLCCHCEGYQLARSTPLDTWQKWIRKNQVQSDYFYSATALTVGDLAALTQSERLQREGLVPAQTDRSLAGFRSASAEGLAEAMRKCPARGTKDEAQDQAIRTIGAMHDLTRYWTADVAKSVIPEDAITLVRATRSLVDNRFIAPDSFDANLEAAYSSELAWYRQAITPPLPRSTQPALDRGVVQRGILTSFDGRDKPISHGALLFFAVTDATAARAALAGLTLASEASEAGEPSDGIFRNLAFTYAGLTHIGLSAEILESAAPAFREGAAARAGMVGDVRGFHPTNWRPLRRNWDPYPESEVPLERVDLLVQLRIASPGAPPKITDLHHPLRDEIVALQALGGLKLLAVEGMAPATEPGSGVNHLGFHDGASQPTLDRAASQDAWSDEVAPGALLVGRGTQSVDPFWQDGSFLAVRRVPIDRKRFDALLDADAKPPLKDRNLLAAKLVGRYPDGTQLGGFARDNNFNFSGDEEGAVCPLQSHIRRANPRVPNTPRIMRRGMSFGPRFVAGGADEETERGSFFMAYCADLAQQYERILTWVNGGNVTRIGSYLSDPLAAPPEFIPRTYRFVEDGKARRVVLPDLNHGVMGLSWSLYLFAPSLQAIQQLKDAPPQIPDASAALAERGRAIIARLQNPMAPAEVWQTVLTAPGKPGASDREAVWAAIRQGAGIVETSVGYLVGSYELVMEVLRDDGARFSNRGAGTRIKEAIGPFHLGLDAFTPEYQRLSKPANEALRSVDEASAFEEARAATKKRIAAILGSAGQKAVPINLVTNLIEPLLADLGTAWFGIPDPDGHIEAGVHDWTVPEGRAPRYPGDFWSPSLHAFSPFHSDEMHRKAIKSGDAAVTAAESLIRSKGLHGIVATQLADRSDAYPTDRDLARVLVGCMIGGVPTVGLNAMRVLIAGLANDQLADVQQGWLTRGKPQWTFDDARGSLGPLIAGPLALAPVPELLWRVVAKDCDLGGLRLKQEDVLVFSLESASRDHNKKGASDTYIPYGMALPGERQTAHGCPGRAMANGTMLGLLVGVLESARFTPGYPPGLATLRPLA